MTSTIVTWLVALVLFCLWLAAMIAGRSAGGLIHLLLAASVGIAMVRLLVYQRRER